LPAVRRDFVLKEFASKPWLKRVDFGRTKNILDDAEGKTVDALMSPMERIRASIENQVAKVFGDKSGSNVNPKDMAGVKVPDSEMNKYRKLLRDNLQGSLDYGYGIAKDELPKGSPSGGKKQPWKVIRPGMDKTQAEKYLASRTMKLAGKVQADLQAAIDNVLDNAIKYDKTLKATIKALEEDTVIDSLLPRIDAAGRAVNVPARLENIARTNISDALNQGRQALFGAPELKGFVVAYEYSAILDDRTSEICEHLHGKILKDFGEYTPPNHYQCRSLLVPVTVVDEWDGKESAKPTMTPNKGFY
jgi:SPP1 gp7 family putative phage head morphogenesis protein